MEQSLNNVGSVGKTQVEPIRKEHKQPLNVPQSLEVPTVTQIKGVNRYFSTFSVSIENIAF